MRDHNFSARREAQGYFFLDRALRRFHFFVISCGLRSINSTRPLHGEKTMASLTLDELESRCEMLQRRVLERAPNSILMASGGSSNNSMPPSQVSFMRSPPRRPSSSTAGASLVARGGSTPSGGNQAALPSSYLSSPSRQGPTSSSQGPSGCGISSLSVNVGGAALLAPSPFTPSDVSFAVSSLEREKARLEEQLRLVNIHLHAYRVMQQPPLRPASALDGTSGVVGVCSASTPRSTLLLGSPTRGSRYLPSAPPPTSSTSTILVSQSSLMPKSPSPSRNRSPPRHSPVTLGNGTTSYTGLGAASLPSPHTPPPGPTVPPTASLQTEQIYEELRLIRKAREEREAQRRNASH